ncbi:hypothetical protein M427DRAFT_55133 [Gonapodya prolifera JEL478]|uniref:Uncharacterized protein n=1 Tax=Gonapodya prolifera (strain JEL478) TaxID=1344416 RepID=A0A139AK38_GONPJ|nr:hypothetical protein M427DRAFT_55133 [Gonapodya prolifera JEL478]|eukprot:KXS16795.1 hypothetical protein M427DRAFT_55133 [Gonapodya prolifera JEL478]
MARERHFLPSLPTLAIALLTVAFFAGKLVEAGTCYCLCCNTANCDGSQTRILSTSLSSSRCTRLNCPSSAFSPPCAYSGTAYCQGGVSDLPVCNNVSSFTRTVIIAASSASVAGFFFIFLCCYFCCCRLSAPYYTTYTTYAPWPTAPKTTYVTVEGGQTLYTTTSANPYNVYTRY